MMNEQTQILVSKAEDYIAQRMREPDWLRSTDVKELLALQMHIEVVKVLSEITVGLDKLDTEFQKERDDG